MLSICPPLWRQRPRTQGPSLPIHPESPDSRTSLGTQPHSIHKPRFLPPVGERKESFGDWPQRNGSLEIKDMSLWPSARWPGGPGLRDTAGGPPWSSPTPQKAFLLGKSPVGLITYTPRQERRPGHLRPATTPGVGGQVPGANEGAGTWAPLARPVGRKKVHPPRTQPTISLMIKSGLTAGPAILFLERKTRVRPEMHT